MTLGNIFEEETLSSGRLIFVDKDVDIKCYRDGVAELIELAVCGGLSMNEARRAVQCLADI